MSRTTSQAVRAVLNEDYDTLNEPTLSPYIDTASAVVDDVVSCYNEQGLTISAARQELLERWLAAHFYQQSDKGYAAKSSDRASATFQGQTAMYLESTLYGQTVLVLEPKGCLKTAAVGAVAAGGLWLGRNQPEQTDYEDR